MSIPTTGEKFAELKEHLTKSCEAAYMLCHLYQMQDEKGANPMASVLSGSWLAIGQRLEKTRDLIVQQAARNFQ